MNRYTSNPGGPLRDLGTWLKDTAHKFWDLANWCGAHWATIWMSGFFFGIGDRLYEAGRKADSADLWVDNLSREIDDVGSWHYIRNKLRDNAPVLYYLYRDPRGEIRYLIGDALGIDPWHLQNASFFIKYLVDTHLHALYSFYLDPTGYIARRLADIHPDLYGFLYFPLKQTREWICEILDIPMGFRDHPEHWAGLLADRLFPNWRKLRDDPLLFLNHWACDRDMMICGLFIEPDKWLWDYIREWFGFPFTHPRDIQDGIWLWLMGAYERTFTGIQSGLYELAEHTIRFFWEGEW